MVFIDGLVPQAQFLDDLAVAVDIRALHVVQQTATLANHLEKATATVVILLVRAKMLSQVIDTLGEQRNLDAGRAAVGLVRLVLLDGRTLFESHVPDLLPAALDGGVRLILEVAK